MVFGAVRRFRIIARNIILCIILSLAAQNITALLFILFTTVAKEQLFS